MEEQPQETKKSFWRSFFGMFCSCSWKGSFEKEPGQPARASLNFNPKEPPETQLPNIKMFETTVNLDTNREDVNTTFKVTQNIELADSLKNMKTSNLSYGNTNINMDGKATNSEFVLDQNVVCKKVDVPSNSSATESSKKLKSHVRGNSL